VHIVPNWSRVAGLVENWEPPTRGETSGTLTLRIRSVASVASGLGEAYANFLQDAEGRIVRVRVPDPVAVTLQIVTGVDIELDVRRGRAPDQLFGRIPQ
jgi:hypothetical protein